MRGWKDRWCLNQVPIPIHALQLQEKEMHLGDVVTVPNILPPPVQGVVRFIGATKFADGQWVGIELR